METRDTTQAEWENSFNPWMLTAANGSPTLLGDICQGRAYLENYLIEKCLPKYYQQLSFKCFAKSFFNSQVIVKSILDPDYNSSRNS